MEPRNKVVALFIDADNAPARKIDLIMSELAVYGAVMIRKIYGNWKKSTLNSWESILIDYAIAPIQQYDYAKGKNATDMAMTIDVMDLLHSKKVDVFCIVSSDSDFTPLAMRIRAEGCQVIGFGEQKTPNSLVKACSRFLYLDNQTNNSNNTGIQKISSNELKCDTYLINLLRDAISQSCDDEGWAYLGMIGNIISNQTSFDSKNYGYPKLSSLIKAINLFDTKSESNNSMMFVRDKRVAK